MSMMTMFELECWRASSSQVVRWLNVSRLCTTENMLRSCFKPSFHHY